MHIKLPMLALLTVCALSTQTALACGESLYRVGKGIVYRDYTAPLPGNILLVASNETEMMLAKALTEAGHKVSVVERAELVREQLNNARYDIVMSRYELNGRIEPALASTNVNYLPVTRDGTDEADMAKSRFPRALKDTDHIKRFLIQIHRTLKARNA